MTDFDISEVASEIEDMSYQEKMEYLEELYDDLERQLGGIHLLISDLQAEHEIEITETICADIEKHIKDQKLEDKITIDHHSYIFNYDGYQFRGLVLVVDESCTFMIEPHKILNNAKAAAAIQTLGEAIGIPATDDRVEISTEAKEIAAKIIEVWEKIGV